MPKYEWLPTESAPKEYPIEILSGNLFYEDGGAIYIPDGRTVNNGWGMFGSTHIVGDALKPLPVKLELTWFSFAENLFWSGSFELPVSLLAEMFEKGVTSRISGKTVIYQDIIVGMAPEGHVSLWVGVEDFTHEVASFQAEQIDVSWESYQGDIEPDRESFIKTMMTEAMGYEYALHRLEKGIVLGQYKRYKKQLPWSFSSTGSGRATSLSMTFFNGEREYFILGKQDILRSTFAVPKSAVLEWLGANGKAYKAIISFEEEEIFAAFEKLIEANQADIVLNLEIADTNNNVAITLNTKNYILPLELVEVKAYSKRQ